MVIPKVSIESRFFPNFTRFEGDNRTIFNSYEYRLNWKMAYKNSYDELITIQRFAIDPQIDFYHRFLATVSSCVQIKFLEFVFSYYLNY